MKKVIMTILLFVVGFVLLPNLTTAESQSTSIAAIPIEEIENLPSEKTYSYQEVLEYMKTEEYESKDIEAFKRKHKENIELQSKKSDSATIRYARLRLDGIEFRNLLKTYRLQPEVVAGLLYSKPNCPDKIVSLEDLHIHAENSAKLVFDGSTTVKLVSGQEIYTLTQGVVYKEGNIKMFLKDISHQETYYSPMLER